ncbi:DNA gyrase inhibitor SbmC [Enterobacteriaceae bacterium ENNIH3]|jgi:DNA gyrase inhibitor|nr:DNA gyrase inhibitor SbmC [Enterobacteriaceae bacterium ENNIH3]AUV08122.1 DNA gyrase inhibitor SbmC [Enterobacteriaceae bacterium ENNIH2]PTA92139.1 DNA gyrase inhibitor SbmC [Kluyvera sp. Nf5]PWF49791.1 DNA gyrase inhibitor SbmC [[Kluyvera] intestini]
MAYTVRQVDKRTIAGFHLVGPWDVTVKKGFEQLAMWVNGKQIHTQEWITVYYDNPDEVPAEKLRADVVVSVPADFVIPENSEGVMRTEIPAGLNAVARARVYNEEFEQAWDAFFDELMADEQYQIALRPCFEVYLNSAQEDGYWEIDMYIPVEPKVL